MAIMDPMKLSHLYDKFMVAVEVLATSPASLQRRLEGAYRSFIDVEPKDFDDKEMRATFEQIRSRISCQCKGAQRPRTRPFSFADCSSRLDSDNVR